METSAPTDDTTTGDELHALRKYIVDMMHVEMELMEQIKQKEENLETTTVRIHHFKDMVTQEQSQNKSLRASLTKDLTDLEVLEGQKIVADAKHKQFQDTVAAREQEAEELRSAYSEVRGVIFRLQQHLRRLGLESQYNSVQDTSVSTKTAEVLLQLENLRQEPDNRLCELQNQRAKKRYTCEKAAQLDKEASDLTAKRSNAEAEHVEAELCIDALCSSLKSSEVDTEKRRQNIQNEVSNIRSNQKIIAAKLAKKQTKFRKMTKTEIASLRRRINFVQSELEKIQMEKEETLSVVFALIDEHGILDCRIKEQSDEILAVEKIISDLGEKISLFDRCESKFNKFEMQQDLAIKQKQIQVIQRGLEEKQQALQQSTLANNQSIEELEKLTDEMSAPNMDIMDERLLIIKEEWKELEGNQSKLQEILSKGQENYATMKARSSSIRRTADQSKKRISSLKKKLKSTELNETNLRQRLKEEEGLRVIVIEALKNGAHLHAEILKEKDQHESERYMVENELKAQEQFRTSRYQEEEEKLKAELHVWDEKIKHIQDEISAL